MMALIKSIELEQMRDGKCKLKIEKSGRSKGSVHILLSYPELYALSGAIKEFMQRTNPVRFVGDQ